MISNSDAVGAESDDGNFVGQICAIKKNTLVRTIAIENAFQFDGTERHKCTVWDSVSENEHPTTVPGNDFREGNEASGVSRVNLEGSNLESDTDFISFSPLNTLTVKAVRIKPNSKAIVTRTQVTVKQTKEISR